jgi:hypothetical protein
MTKDVTIVVPFARNPVWLQTCVASFKEHKSQADILVIDNSIGSRQGIDTRVITETSFGDGVKVIPQYQRYYGNNEIYGTHAAALNMALRMINTKYLFATESDVVCMRDGWLDWYIGRIEEKVAMIGWFWPPPGRRYISPSMTLYDTRVLRLIDEEVMSDKGMNLTWGFAEAAMRGQVDHWKMLMRDRLLGPFNEMRTRGTVPEWNLDKHDTASWLYFRLLFEYKCLEVPGGEIWLKDQIEGSPPTKYQFVGDEEKSAYLIHYQAGTISHDYDVIPITVEWVANYQEWWLRREYRIWEEVVPEFVRRDSINKGLIPSLESELERAMAQIKIGLNR